MTIPRAWPGWARIGAGAGAGAGTASSSNKGEREVVGSAGREGESARGEMEPLSGRLLRPLGIGTGVLPPSTRETRRSSTLARMSAKLSLAALRAFDLPLPSPESEWSPASGASSLPILSRRRPFQFMPHLRIASFAAPLIACLSAAAALLFSVLRKEDAPEVVDPASEPRESVALMPPGVFGAEEEIELVRLKSSNALSRLGDSRSRWDAEWVELREEERRATGARRFSGFCRVSAAPNEVSCPGVDLERAAKFVLSTDTDRPRSDCSSP
jgi:hypothetical protein